MSDEVIHRRLQTYHDETFKTLSYYPSHLIYEVDASRSAIEVLCSIANRLADDPSGAALADHDKTPSRPFHYLTEPATKMSAPAPSDCPVVP